MGKIYGNVINRFAEGKNYTGREIKVGDDITMYLWSDRYCYYVTEVIDQKHIKVKPYYVCADKEKAYGMGHQEWKYFKTMREYDKYVGRDERADEEYEKIDREDSWAFRYGKWQKEATFTDENYCTEKELKCLKKNGFYKRYFPLLGKVSFGVRDYYYDWEF